MSRDDQSNAFVLLDGDDIGAGLEEAIWRDDHEAYVRRSAELSEFFEGVGTRLRSVGVSVLAIGGDSVVAQCFTSEIDAVLDVLNEVGENKSVTFSVGIGRTLSRAHIALRIAKTSGKGRIHVESRLPH